MMSVVLSKIVGMRFGKRRIQGSGFAQHLMCVILWAVGLSGVASEPVWAREFPGYPAVTSVSSTELPPQARSTLVMIYQGGPFRYDKDGTVFGNRERLLPINTRGYYREYTVKTPRVSSRGARRIVCGGYQPAAPDACYYTDDHYASFRKIVQ